MSNHAGTHEIHHPGPKTFIIVWVALTILAALTVYIAQFHFGDWNVVVAMVIASIKATIVALYFMHLKYEDKLTWVYALYPLFLLFLLISSTIMDVFTRIPTIH